MRSTIVRLVLALIAGLAALLVLVPAATASASTLVLTTAQDNQYVLVLESYGITSTAGPQGLVVIGHQIASDVYYGVRTAIQERDYCYANTGASITVTDCNVLVNAALYIYLGVPLPGSGGSGGGSSGVGTTV